jgi:hypothetical protein
MSEAENWVLNSAVSGNFPLAEKAVLFASSARKRLERNMYKSRLVLTFAIATAAFGIGGGVASAEVICNQIGLSSASITSYHGYSNKVAKPGAPGTSTVLSGKSTTTKFCFDSDTGETVPEEGGTKTTTSKNYVDGPGNSPFGNRNPISSTCEATGTLSCP